MEHFEIPTFIINLEKRKDRRHDVSKQFADRREFKVNIIKAIEHEFGGFGHWQTIQYILNNHVSHDDRYILICEDDHVFTESYNSLSFLENINEAERLEADFLLGGVSWFNYSLQISQNLFWIKNFSGLQFVVVFRKFFKTIITADFNKLEAGDFKFAALSKNKLLIHPFVSIQKEYGYSDITAKNENPGYVTQIFSESSDKINHMRMVGEFYRTSSSGLLEVRTSEDRIDLSNIAFRTFYLNSTPNREKEKTIFKNRTEFSVTELKDSGDLNQLWKQIQSIIKLSLNNYEDVIIFCKNGICFTTEYTFEFFLQQVLEANQLGVGILLGNVSKANHFVPMTQHLCWVDVFNGANFFVIFRNVFHKILAEKVDDRNTLSRIFSEITSNKMVIHPFITNNIHDEKYPMDVFARERIEELYELKSFYSKFYCNE